MRSELKNIILSGHILYSKWTNASHLSMVGNLPINNLLALARILPP